MDYLLNNELFEHDNDETLPRIESELWPNDTFNEWQNDNQFFNDQDFDINSFSLSLDDDNNKLMNNKTKMSPNMFQASPEVFATAGDCLPARSNPRKVTLLQKRKISLDDRDIFNMCHSESKRFSNEDNRDIEVVCDDIHVDLGHKSAFNVASLSGAVEEKFRRPNNISLIQVAPNDSFWEERANVTRMKYSLSPSTSSPESAIDCSISTNMIKNQSNNRDLTFLQNENNFSNRYYEVKFKSQREDSFPTRLSNNGRLFQNPIPQSGVLILTEEEKRTLLTEGYQIPCRLPLTKHEERNLKKVRRKIKNKISAQESRRKKKEYMEALEKKVEIYAHENIDLRKKLENQENANKSLIGQLRHLQHMLGRATSNTTSTCVMVFLICFSLILVGFPEPNQPMKLPQSVLVGNIHKVGYGSLLQRDKSHITAMQRYLPPDIDAFVDTFSINEDVPIDNETRQLMTGNRGNEPLDSLELATSGQRKSILLGNIKEDEDECVQYGPRYLWWLLQSPNFNTDDIVRTKDIGTLGSENSDVLHFSEAAESIVMVHLKTRKNESSLHNGSSWYDSKVETYKLAVNLIAT